jgi:cysteine synthase
MLLTEAKGGAKVGPQGPHKIQGMGAGLIPAVLDLNMVDEVVAVHSDQAMEMAHHLWLMGIPVGVSSGAIFQAAVQVCQRSENANKVAVCIMPSFGERYFSHPMFEAVKSKAEGLEKQPLPEPYDNTAYGFATARG